jgi:hypothetical protein
MFRLIYLLITIILLSSNSPLICLEMRDIAQKSIEFGIADIQIAAVVDDEKTVIAQDIIIVRIIGQKNHVLSYGMTDEGGTVAMPLPPGRYCYELFSYKGKALETRRKGESRCFDIEKDIIKTVYIEYILNEKPLK